MNVAKRSQALLELSRPKPRPASVMPDPRPLSESLARSVIEILAGTLEVAQISEWITVDVYRHLLKRTVLAARNRQAEGRPAVAPAFTIGAVITTEPSRGIVESIVLVRGHARSKVIAMRMEGLGDHWQVSSLRLS